MSMCELRQDHRLLWLTYKIDQFVSQLLIVGLVWYFVWDLDGRWFAIFMQYQGSAQKFGVTLIMLYNAVIEQTGEVLWLT